MSPDSLPATMRAVIVQPDHTVAVEERPVPTLEDGEILVKVAAIAQNPTDWKHMRHVTRAPGNILGCDFSGVVVRTAGAHGVAAPGTRVAGFVQGGHFRDRGAYAEYVKTDADLVWAIPPELSHEEAATMGCALWTAVQALFHPGRLALAEPPQRAPAPGPWILVYGGSTSVGQFTIQLAHRAGYNVAATASPQNHALLTSLGASVAVDYNAPDAVAALKHATNDTLHLAVDCISSATTQPFCVRALGPGPGHVVVLTGPKESATSLRADANVQFTLIYTALGRAFTLEAHFPVSPEDRAHMAQFLPKLAGLGVRPNKVRPWAGGLDGVAEGLAWMMAGNVSAEKIVYTL